MAPTPLLILLTLAAPLQPTGGEGTTSESLDPGDSEAPRTLRARAAQGEMNLDGRLRETVWETAHVASNFTQYEPSEGETPTYPTEVRIVYGTDALYVGAELTDEEPDRILATASRRDELNQSDRFLVAIDSYFDRQTAFVFGVSAAGVQVDWIMENPRRRRGPPDTSWDAIWYSEVTVTETGWTVEMEIPYSMLRFSPGPSMRWGIQFRREIARLSEVDEWIYVPRTDNQYVANFGVLTGMDGIEPSRNVQVTPYTLSSLSTEPTATGATDYGREIDVGADLKVGLSSSVTLDATVNPDFGQVESDPAVLNLSTFETFFPEKRPFFLEGTQIFDFDFVGRDGSLLYTRRIGGSDSPIVGATKLTGRTQSGYSFGVLGAGTGRDLDPGRFYGAGRFKRDFGTTSYLGTGLTAYTRSASTGRARRAYAGGLDWDVRFGDQAYQFRGYGVVSSVGDGDEPAETGFSGHLGVSRLRGNWTGQVDAIVFDDEFDVNDVGQLRQNDMVRLFTSNTLLLNENEPFGPFRRADAGFFAWKTWSYAGGIDRGYDGVVFSNWHLNNFHTFGLTLSPDALGGYDTRETRGLGPYENPGGLGYGLEYESDSRKRWQISPQLDQTWMLNGGTEIEFALETQWDVSSRVTLSSEFEHTQERNVEAWTANEPILERTNGYFAGPSNTPPSELASDGTSGGFSTRLPRTEKLRSILADVAPAQGANRWYVPVFGRRDTREFNLQLRANFVFRPRLTLQLFNQVFVARGRYEQFGVLTDPSTLRPYRAYPKRHDFALRSYISNVVLRWEYRRGSSVFLVWTQNRSFDQDSPLVDPSTPSPYEKSTGDLLRETFELFPRNVFLVKLEYTFLND